MRLITETIKNVHSTQLHTRTTPDSRARCDEADLIEMILAVGVAAAALTLALPVAEGV